MSYEEDFRTLLKYLGQAVRNDSWDFEEELTYGYDFLSVVGLKKKKSIMKPKTRLTFTFAHMVQTLEIGQPNGKEHPSMYAYWKYNDTEFESHGLEPRSKVKLYLYHFESVSKRPSLGGDDPEGLYKFPVHKATLVFQYEEEESNGTTLPAGFSLTAELIFQWPYIGEEPMPGGYTSDDRKPHLDINDARVTGTEETLSAFVSRRIDYNKRESYYNEGLDIS